MTAVYKIFNEDCREAIKKLSDNSVDLIVTYPPYFIDGMVMIGMTKIYISAHQKLVLLEDYQLV